MIAVAVSRKILKYVFINKASYSHFSNVVLITNTCLTHLNPIKLWLAFRSYYA